MWRMRGSEGSRGRDGLGDVVRGVRTGGVEPGAEGGGRCSEERVVVGEPETGRKGEGKDSRGGPAQHREGWPRSG